MCTENVSPSSVLSADDCTVEKASDKEPDQVFEIFNQSIWNNKYILKHNESLFYPHLCKKASVKLKISLMLRTQHPSS